MAITASQARAQLFPLIDQLCAGGDPVVITSKSGNAVLISEAEFSNMVENIYIMSNPAFAQSILDGRKELAAGQGTSYLLDELIDILRTDAPLPKKISAKPRKKSVSTRSGKK
jgi:antitoxin YefM